MFFIITQTIIFLLILFLLYLLTWFLPTDSPWSPWWSTNAEVSRAIGKLAKVTKKDIFYELGSGTGTTVCVIAKEFGARCVGIETDGSRVLWSRLKLKLTGQTSKVEIIKKSFYDIDLPRATVVYMYLVPRVIKKLKQKLLKELQPGTRVISYIYPIDYLSLLKKDEKQQLYMYTVAKSPKVRRESHP